MIRTIKQTVKQAFGPLKSWLLRESWSEVQEQKLLLGSIASFQVRSLEVLNSLQDAEFKVNSQWGQDGIIDWLVERAGIPRDCQTFVEFGVETYRQANTRFLLANRRWRGLILDGSDAMLEACRQDHLFWAYDLTAKPAFITRENINDLIAASGFGGEIGLLSIDVDGNDYWVWEAIEVVRPILIVCEYNAVLGDLHAISVPYDPQFYRTDKHFSNLYFGASIAALRSLGVKKGYRFMGTTTSANDAFFVREDYAERFADKALRSIVAWPSNFRESKDQSGELNYLRGMERLRQIAHLPVVNTETGATTTIGELGQVYSEGWLAAMPR